LFQGGGEGGGTGAKRGNVLGSNLFSDFDVWVFDPPDRAASPSVRTGIAYLHVHIFSRNSTWASYMRICWEAAALCCRGWGCVTRGHGRGGAQSAATTVEEGIPGRQLFRWSYRSRTSKWVNMGSGEPAFPVCTYYPETAPFPFSPAMHESSSKQARQSFLQTRNLEDGPRPKLREHSSRFSALCMYKQGRAR